MRGKGVHFSYPFGRITNVGMLLVMLVACATEKGTLPWSGGSEGDDDGPDAVGEDWDDEMADSGTTTEEGFCGDEIVDAGEDCDEGKDQAPDLEDGCSQDCKVVPTLVWTGDGEEGVLTIRLDGWDLNELRLTAGSADCWSPEGHEEYHNFQPPDNELETDTTAVLQHGADDLWLGNGSATMFCPSDESNLAYFVRMNLVTEDETEECWASGPLARSSCLPL